MDQTDIDFTGERVVPGKTPFMIYLEHIHRYIFAARFAQDMLVLDVACGAGYGLDYLKSKGARQAVGIDRAMEAVNYARDRFGHNEPIDYLCADATLFPCGDGRFDMITSFETIEHVLDYEVFLAECVRVLKASGLFICSTPNRKVFSPTEDQPPNPFHVKEFWPDEFYDLLSGYFEEIRFYGQRNVRLSDNVADKNCEVYGFTDNERTQSAYVIAVARKGEKG